VKPGDLQIEAQLWNSLAPPLWLKESVPLSGTKLTYVVCVGSGLASHDKKVHSSARGMSASDVRSREGRWKSRSRAAEEVGQPKLSSRRRMVWIERQALAGADRVPGLFNVCYSGHALVWMTAAISTLSRLL
jgi:hypothetical protein